MKNKVLMLSILIIAGFPFFILAQTDYEQWKQAQSKELTEMEAESNNYLESVSREYDNYQAEQTRQFEDFRTKVEQKWAEFKQSSAKKLVTYDKDLNSRSSIDFEKGEIEVEVIIEDSPGKTNKQKEKEAVASLERKIEKVITQPASDKKPILKDQLKEVAGANVSPRKLKEYAKVTVKKQPIKKTVTRAKDGKTRIRYTVKMKMVPNHLEIRAKRFKDEILKQSTRFNIDAAVTFAIMQTESSFNPEARSHIPAYGLMQLVPRSGARDAYNFVYKKDKLLPGKYLYDPTNNIELGCAYISKLRHVYFSRINDDKTAYFCTIAAYNTGAGNVARALTGTTKLRPTAEVVNQKSPEQVYKLLLNKLPYDETKHYLTTVTERMGYYKAWSE